MSKSKKQAVRIVYAERVVAVRAEIEKLEEGIKCLSAIHELLLKVEAIEDLAYEEGATILMGNLTLQIKRAEDFGPPAGWKCKKAIDREAGDDC